MKGRARSTRCTRIWTRGRREGGWWGSLRSSVSSSRLAESLCSSQLSHADVHSLPPSSASISHARPPCTTRSSSSSSLPPAGSPLTRPSLIQLHRMSRWCNSTRIIRHTARWSPSPPPPPAPSPPSPSHSRRNTMNLMSRASCWRVRRDSKGGWCEMSSSSSRMKRRGRKQWRKSTNMDCTPPSASARVMAASHRRRAARRGSVGEAWWGRALEGLEGWRKRERREEGVEDAALSCSAVACEGVWRPESLQPTVTSSVRQRRRRMGVLNVSEDRAERAKGERSTDRVSRRHTRGM